MIINENNLLNSYYLLIKHQQNYVYYNNREFIMCFMKLHVPLHFLHTWQHWNSSVIIKCYCEL